jgi:hypothetical protein
MFTTCDFFLASWNMISDLQEIGQDPEPSCKTATRNLCVAMMKFCLENFVW